MRIQVNGRNRAYEFECSGNDRILLAGLQNGVDLPYECGSGTCGTCKAKLIEGELEDRWLEAPGRKLLKADHGEFLMCQCSPKTDVSVEVASFVYADRPGSHTPALISGTVASSTRLLEEIIEIVVSLERPMAFDAGQFVLLEVPGVVGFRGYSMVNFDRRASRLEFIVKRKPGGGVSDWLFAGDRRGAKVRIFGPLGKASFYPNLGKHVLCIAGGTGIAGMISIVTRGVEENYFQRHRGDVFFGVRTPRDTFFLERLSALRCTSPENLRITVALSEGEQDLSELAASDPDLAFDLGLVHEVAARRMRGRYENVRAYLAGPPVAVEAAIRVLLLEAKLTTDNIRYDKFS